MTLLTSPPPPPLPSSLRPPPLLVRPPPLPSAGHESHCVSPDLPHGRGKLPPPIPGPPSEVCRLLMLLPPLPEASSAPTRQLVCSTASTQGAALHEDSARLTTRSSSSKFRTRSTLRQPSEALPCRMTRYSPSPSFHSTFLPPCPHAPLPDPIRGAAPCFSSALSQHLSLVSPPPPCFLLRNYLLSVFQLPAFLTHGPLFHIPFSLTRSISSHSSLLLFLLLPPPLTSLSHLGFQYVLAVVVQNRYPHDWSLAIDKVELSSPASSLTGWNIRWMGCEEENLILHRTEQQSIVCLLEPSSTQVSTLPESMQLVIWWRLRGGGGGESKMKVVDLHMGSVSRRLQGLDMQTSRDMNIMCSIRNNDKVRAATCMIACLQVLLLSFLPPNALADFDSSADTSPSSTFPHEIFYFPSSSSLTTQNFRARS